MGVVDNGMLWRVARRRRSEINRKPRANSNPAQRQRNAGSTRSFARSARG